MHIQMLETRCGTENGYTIRQYQAGVEYELADGLARAFLAAGFAVLVPEAAKESKETIATKKKKRAVKKSSKSSKVTEKACRSKSKRPVLHLIKE